MNKRFECWNHFLNDHVIQRSNYSSNAPKILRKMNDFTCILLPCLISWEFKFAFVLISLHFELFQESGQTLSRGPFRDCYFLYQFTLLYFCWVMWFSRRAIMMFHQRRLIHFYCKNRIKILFFTFIWDFEFDLAILAENTGTKLASDTTAHWRSRRMPFLVHLQCRSPPICRSVPCFQRPRRFAIFTAKISSPAGTDV